MSALGAIDVPIRASVSEASFTLKGARSRVRRTDSSFMHMVLRDEYDTLLLDYAQSQGVEVRTGVRARGWEDARDGVVVHTDHSQVTGTTLVIADGSASALARQLNTKMAQQDLGLEVELDGSSQGDRWRNRLHLDWGPIPGSYGWVFPKGETLTVGVIAQRGRPRETKSYLTKLLEDLRLDECPVVRDSGHLTQCRTNDSPLGKGRVLLVGDAAGLLEPWTREGISFAIRSGLSAGRHCAEFVQTHDQEPARTYKLDLQGTLLPEISAGHACLSAFKAKPAAFHWLIAESGIGWSSFVRICRGSTTLGRAYRHRLVRTGLDLLPRLP